MAGRVNTINLIIGDRGCGKTTFVQGGPELKIKGVLPTYDRSKSIVKQLVVDTFDNPVWKHVPIINIEQLPQWKTGKYRLFNSDTDLILSEIEQHCYNTVIVFEDATKFLKRYLTKDIERLLYDTKQKNVDIFLIYHHMWAVPNDLIRIADSITLFKTGDNFDNSLFSKYGRNAHIEKLFKDVAANPSPYYCKSIKLGA